MSLVEDSRSMDPRMFRDVLGHFPTGVVAITAMSADGEPVGMVVGSFTSASLDPPLVAYLPSIGSSSYAELREVDRFCVNVLSDRQEGLCRAFATKKGSEKFADATWTLSPLGSPVLEGAVAWIDCMVQDELPAGDHYIVLGKVVDLQIAEPTSPLVFHQGGYGSLETRSRVAPATPELLDQLPVVDAVRPAIEDLAEQLDLECVVMARDGDDHVVRIASAGRPSGGRSPILVGQRLPLRAPLASLLVAWEPQAAQEEWVRRGPGDAPVERYLDALASVRSRGWVLGLSSPTYRELDRLLVELPDGPEKAARLKAVEAELGGPQAFEPGAIDPDARYDVRHASVPLFSADGRAHVYVSLFGFPEGIYGSELIAAVELLRATVGDVSGIG